MMAYLQSLLLIDRIKAALPQHCLKHVLSVESNLEKPFWLEPNKLVQVIDEYMSNVINSADVNSLPIGQAQNAGTGYSTGTRFPAQNIAHSVAKPVLNHVEVKPNNPVFCDGSVKRCHLCDSPFHLRAQCDRLRQTQTGYGRGKERKLINACRSTTEAVVVPRDQSSTHTGGGRPVLAAAAAQTGQSAVTDAGGPRACVNRETE